VSGLVWCRIAELGSVNFWILVLWGPALSRLYRERCGEYTPRLGCGISLGGLRREMSGGWAVDGPAGWTYLYL